MIAKKQSEAGVSPTPTSPQAQPVVDILEALKKTIEMARKPAEPQPPRKSVARVTETKGERSSRKAR